jgi:hypothetical protein
VPHRLELGAPLRLERAVRQDRLHQRRALPRRTRITAPDAELEPAQQPRRIGASTGALLRGSAAGSALPPSASLTGIRAVDARR